MWIFGRGWMNSIFPPAPFVQAARWQNRTKKIVMGIYFQLAGDACGRKVSSAALDLVDKNNGLMIDHYDERKLTPYSIN